MKASDQTTATKARAGESACPRSMSAAPKTDFALRRASEVDAENAPDSALGSTVNWVRDFLARPHRDVGRAGPVCPFTPMALELDTIWLAEIAEAEALRTGFDALAK